MEYMQCGWEINAHRSAASDLFTTYVTALVKRNLQISRDYTERDHAELI